MIAEIRRSLKRLDRAIDKRTLDARDFRALLTRAGFTPGAVVLAHSSMTEITRRVPEMTPVAVIRLMFQLVGEGGTILMPTFPFQGKQLHYVESHRTFDVRKTPSKVGLLTEVFRRMPGVVRSLHPTHPFAAWGARAQELTSEHHLGETFGRTSPIHKMSEAGGTVVGVGTGLRNSFTILHVIEELHPREHERFFEPQPRTMTIINGEAQFEYTFHSLRADVTRNYDRVENALRNDGTLRQLETGGLRCTVSDARQFIERGLQLAEAEKYL